MTTLTTAQEEALRLRLSIHDVGGRKGCEHGQPTWGSARLTTGRKLRRILASQARKAAKRGGV